MDAKVKKTAFHSDKIMSKAMPAGTHAGAIDELPPHYVGEVIEFLYDQAEAAASAGFSGGAEEMGDHLYSLLSGGDSLPSDLAKEVDARRGELSRARYLSAHPPIALFIDTQKLPDGVEVSGLDALGELD
jgi:hypothetical protein